MLTSAKLNVGELFSGSAELYVEHAKKYLGDLLSCVGVYGEYKSPLRMVDD